MTHVKPAKQISAILGVVALLCTSAMPARAQNYPWCANYSMGQGGSRNCGFISFQQCMATVQGMGGFCAENNTYVPPPGPHPKKKAWSPS